MIYDTLFKDITEKCLFKKHHKVLIAVSGGVDSMNLLHFLHAYQKEFALSIGVVHVNHKQRPESNEEEAYLRNWAKEHQIPFYCAYFVGKFSEKAARDFRYHFFKKIMLEQGYSAVVTAHHADDQAETIFLRLLRGSRLRYLRGMKQVQPFGVGELIRPFLAVKKADLPNSFHFEDASNACPQFLRNRIRNHYLPQLERENPQLKKHLIAFGQETELLMEAFSDLTSRLDYQKMTVFDQQSSAVQYFLLQDYLSQFPDLNVTKQQFSELLHILRTKSYYHHSLKNGYYIKKTNTFFEISKIGPETDSLFQKIVLKYGDTAHYHHYYFSFQPIDDRTLVIPLFSQNPLFIRPRQTGDKLALGDYSKKLRRLFIDEKLTQEERKAAIVIEQDQKIIAVLINDKTYLRKASKDDIIKGKLYFSHK